MKNDMLHFYWVMRKTEYQILQISVFRIVIVILTIYKSESTEGFNIMIAIFTICGCKTHKTQL